MELILTRFLYSKDEVELSLITALLKHEELEIIYYWAYELYYSGFEIFNLLLQIYWDFYYEKQPYLLAYIKKKQQLWKADGDMKHVAYVLRNMYGLKATPGVFLARQFLYSDANIGPTILYKFKQMTLLETTVAWLEGYAKPYHNLLIALSRRHWENMWYYLKELVEQEGVEAVGKVLGQFLGMEGEFVGDISIHYIIAIIVRALLDMDMDMDMDMDKDKHVFIVPKKAHLLELIALEEEQIPITYNTLLHKRRVAIEDTIGSFTLARWKWTEHQDFVKEMWFHWEYYAMASPLWLKRLSLAGGWVNHMTKKIDFLSEAEEAGFYELYAYELDELPKVVQDMSLKPLEKSRGDVWFNYVFGTSKSAETSASEAVTDPLWQWKHF